MNAWAAQLQSSAGEQTNAVAASHYSRWSEACSFCPLSQQVIVGTRAAARQVSCCNALPLHVHFADCDCDRDFLRFVGKTHLRQRRAAGGPVPEEVLLHERPAVVRVPVPEALRPHAPTPLVHLLLSCRLHARSSSAASNVRVHLRVQTDIKRVCSE